jgi:hypothetical protein
MPAVVPQRRFDVNDHTSMKRKLYLASALIFLGSVPAMNSVAQDSKATAGKVAAMAASFFGTLDDTQRSNVVFDFKNEAQRKRWSNLPIGSVPRAGLRMGDLTQPQRDAVLAMLSAALSHDGYEKVMQIVEGDEVLKTGDGGRPGGPGGPGGRRDGPPGGRRDGPPPGGPGGPGERGGPGGGGSQFGRDNYYVSILGQPSPTEPWMIQFGGHHLGLNITYAGKEATLAPSHTGAQPAIYQLEGKTVRPLGREVDKAFALVSSLDEAQRKQAILGVQMRDLVLGPGHDGQTIQPEGIKGSALTEKQREMMLDLAGEWTGIMNDAVAKAKMAQMKKDVAETWFAWSGPTEKDAAAYFRVQGPSVFIEYAPQRLGGDATKHIHTIYRDPANDYGVNWWKK